MTARDRPRHGQAQAGPAGFPVTGVFEPVKRPEDIFASIGGNTGPSSVTIFSDGPYAGTRNPIYVAMLLIYAGIVVVANAPAVVALMPVLFAVLHFGVGLREEDYLECKFGDAYLAYKLAVPRWL